MRTTQRLLARRRGFEAVQTKANLDVPPRGGSSPECCGRAALMLASGPRMDLMANALAVTLTLAQPAPARSGPTMAREDTMHTEVPEVLVAAPRVTLDEILDRVATFAITSSDGTWRGTISSTAWRSSHAPRSTSRCRADRSGSRPTTS